jgi:hypothetical protein
MTKQYLYIFSRILLFLLLLALFTAACSGGTEIDSGTLTPTPTETPIATITPSGGVFLDNGSGNTDSQPVDPQEEEEEVEEEEEEEAEVVQSYRVKGESNNVSFVGLICSLERTFYIDATFPGGSGRTVFTPIHLLEGETASSGGGEGCTQSGSGRYVIAMGEDGYGTITWSEDSTLTCPDMNNKRSVTFQVALIPAPELICP